MLDRLPDSYAATRESLRALACYAVSPARKARTGRIGLRPTGGGFGTPPFRDGSRIVVRGDRLARQPGAEIGITTLRAAGRFLGVDLSPDPGVGADLPPFEPDRPLAVDREASAVLGRWYAFGQQKLDGLAGRLGPGDSMSGAQVWPEHFDLASQVTLEGDILVTVGFSPGDAFSPEPYVYVGSGPPEGLTGDYWNAPFGAYRSHRDAGEALEFLLQGLQLLRQARHR